MIPVAWLVLSLFIGYLGRNRVLGFWGHFIVSLLLSPLVGALTVAIARDSSPRHA